MEKAKVFDLLNKFIVCKHIGKALTKKQKVVKLYPVFPNSARPNLSDARSFVMVDDLTSFIGDQGKVEQN